MALYTFRNRDTDEAIEFSVNMSDYDKFVEELGPSWDRVFVPLNIISGRLNVGRVDDGFTDVLKRIKSGSGRNNTIHTKN
jgi:hypothetical protein